MIEIRRATRDDECTIAAILTQAKARLGHSICAAAKQGAKSGASPLGLVLAIDRMTVGACLRAGCTCLIAEDDGTPAAVAVLECPGEEALTLRNLLRSGAKRLTRFVKPGALPGGMRAVSGGARCAQQEMRVVDIAVDELWQGQGLTRMLIEHAADEARARGLKRLTVTACAPGESERYEQMGFALSDARTQELWGVSMPEQDMSLMLCEDEDENANAPALLGEAEGEASAVEASENEAESEAGEDETDSEVREDEPESKTSEGEPDSEASEDESECEACEDEPESEASEGESKCETCEDEPESKAFDAEPDCAAPEPAPNPSVICIDADEIDLGMNAWRRDD